MNFFLDSLLDLPDVRVRNVVQETGQVFLELACLREVATCPHYQNSSEEVNQSRPTLIRDLSIFGKPVYLKIPGRQFYCRHCQKYFTEQLSFVEDGRRYTRRYEMEIYERVKATNVEQVSREEDLSWDRVQGIFEHQRLSYVTCLDGQSNDRKLPVSMICCWQMYLTFKHQPSRAIAPMFTIFM